jgi:hypothetical protein
MNHHHQIDYFELMKRTTPHITAVTFFLFSFSFSFSQAVSVKATINRDKIMIGEPIELKLEAKVPTGMDAKWFPLDSITHFDFIDKGKIDTTVTTDFKNYTQTLTITSFDSGRWAVSSFPLEIGNKQYLTDSLPVSVAYSNFDPSKDYHDIKDILEVENADVKYVNPILAALAVLSLLAVIYFLRKKATVQQPVAVKKALSKLSPLEEAMQSLEELKKQGYANTGGVKIFHSSLNDILRWFMYRKTNIGTMEKTSAELMLQLKQFNLPNDEFINLAQALRMNDAVKFAKYQPPAAENDQSMDTIKKSIEQLDKIISP